MRAKGQETAFQDSSQHLRIARWPAGSAAARRGTRGERAPQLLGLSTTPFHKGGTSRKPPRGVRARSAAGPGVRGPAGAVVASQGAGEQRGPRATVASVSSDWERAGPGHQAATAKGTERRGSLCAARGRGAGSGGVLPARAVARGTWKARAAEGRASGPVRGAGTVGTVASRARCGRNGPRRRPPAGRANCPSVGKPRACRVWQGTRCPSTCLVTMAAASRGQETCWG